MAYHDLKIDPEFFEAVQLGSKTAELRRNDRDFKVGDWLILKEYFNGYTGRQVAKKIAHIASVKRIIGQEYVLISMI